MTPPTAYQRSTISTLTSKLEQELPLSYREEFSSRLRMELNSQPIQAILHGSIPIDTMFGIIRRSLQQTQHVAVSRADALPWESLFHVVLQSLEQLMANPQREAPRTQTEHTLPTEDQSNHSGPRQGVRVESSSAVNRKKTTVAAPNNAAIVAFPSVEQVLEELDCGSLRASELYRRSGQKYIKCTVEDCKFCPAMYKSMAITPCSQFGHASCNQLGWFPHVGISLWKILRSQHDAGLPFKPRDIESKEGQLPPLNFLIAQREAAERPGPVQATPVHEQMLWADMCA